jgi:hypothetical protein
MSQQYPAQEIPGALDRLIEAWHDHEEASRELEEHKRTNQKPPVPSDPLDVDTLQDYHRRRMEHEAGLEEPTRKLDTARKNYEKLQDEVRRFLPQGRLFYEYQGARAELADRYLIQDTGIRFTIEPYTDARRRGLGVYGGDPNRRATGTTTSGALCPPERLRAVSVLPPRLLGSLCGRFSRLWRGFYLRDALQRRGQ